MADTVRAFEFELGNGGYRITARNPDWVCAGCWTDDEIDTNIRLLKEDLEALGERMKAALRKRGPGVRLPQRS